jgi:CHAT domain-containing protein
MLREVPGYGHGLLATAHSMLERSKSYADRLELLATLDDRSWVANGFDPDRLAEGLKVAGIDASKPLPEVAWFIAELLKEKGRPDVALSWTDRGIKQAEGRSEAALMLMLNWQKAELLWSMNRGEAALAVLEESESKLLPVIRKQERESLARPARAYTKTLKGGILASLGRDGLATPMLYDAERELALDPVKTKWKERTHALIRAYRAQAQRAAAKSDAKAALAYFDQVVPKAQTVLERDAEEKALETQIKLAIGDGNYEEAQRLTERLTLKGQNKFAGGVISQSPARQQALDEIRRLQTQIQDAGRELENRAAAEGGDKKGQRQPEAAPSRPAEANPLRGAMFPERSVEDLKRQRAQAQRQLKQYFVEMKRKHPEIASLVGAEPTELAQLQAYLGQGHALVQYLLLADRGWAFVATDKKLDVVEIAVTRTALEKNVRVFRTALQSSSTAGKNQGESPGQEVAGRWLTEKLITPVLPHLVGATHLVIIPNGDLHFLPFASLPVESGYLVERYSLSQLPAASALAMVTRASAETKELLAIGNATPISSQWAPLPGAEAEIRSIASRLTGRPSSMHVRDDAMRSRLVDPSAAGKLVHLALHGEAGALDQTRLVFSDGFLKVSEIWGLALDGSPLVVLSACETALGERLPGDEVTSMANGFLFAGARAVVATLWKVPDANTQVLFDRFYDLLLAGSTPSEALTGAQRNMIANKYPTGAWAAFVASGR